MVTAVFLWLSERLRDAALWPINLVRDFPLRITRLGHTLAQGGRGLLRFPPDGIAARRRGEGKRWLHHAGGRTAFWLHQFLSQLFDLAGGPEIAQFFMHLITRTTPLTGPETGIIASVLGPTALRFEDVRVAEGGVMDWVFKLNGNLAFATWHTINLPRNGRHTRANLPILIHELTHVYQYEKVGSRYLGEAIYMLIKTKRDCYNYGGPAGLETAHRVGKKYRDFNREQQAKITQDYFTLLRQEANLTAYEPFINQARQGDL